MLRTAFFVSAAVALSALVIAAISGPKGSRTQADIDLTGTWDLTGWSGTLGFSCVTNLVHGPIPTTVTPNPSPVPTPSTQPIVIDDLSGTIQCGGGIPSTSADVLGSVDEASGRLEFIAQGLFGCGALFGSANYSADGNSMSNGIFECTPVVVANWTATRRLSSLTPTLPPCPLPTPAPGDPTPTPPPTPGPTEFDVLLTFTFVNELEQSASDLHICFDRGVGGAVLDTNAPDCPAPAVTHAVRSREVDVVWPSACVDPGESVKILIGAPGSALVQCSFWTLFGSLLTTCPGTSASPTLTATPTLTPTPSPTSVRQQTLAVDPTSGPMGIAVTLSGANWTPANDNPPYAIFWGLVGGTPLSTFAPDTQGNFSTEVITPVGYSDGMYAIYACEGYGGGSQVCGSVDFTLMTPTVSPIPTPTPTPAFEKGDVDCDGDFDAVDALKVLRHVAGLSVFQNDGCGPMGTVGNMDCDSDADAVDALRILRYVAGLNPNLPGGCPPIGS